MRQSNLDKHLRILDYYQVIEEIKRITSNNNFIKQISARTVLDNIEIPYYTLGSGDNHIVVCSATHGSEIITVDFVLRLMEMIATKQGIYSNIDLDTKEGYTFHFLPLHNPEGYIISTSAIRTKISREASEEEIEKIAKEYFLNYRQDDINSKQNPDDKSQKRHQAMFASANYECIPNEFKILRESVKEIYSNSAVPQGSIVVHRGNGLGAETNRGLLARTLTGKHSSIYGSMRYNNINITIPGPLGTFPINDNIIENKLLKNILAKLYKEQKYCGMLTYHSTGGLIYSKVSNDDEYLVDFSLPDQYYENKYQTSIINRILTRKYQKDTMYISPNGSQKEGYKIVSNSSLKDFDESLRMLYPAVLLIELSYMGGNPLGPFGDKENNYLPTIEYNLIAANNFFKNCKYLKKAMYDNLNLIDEEISSEFEKEMIKSKKIYKNTFK